MRRMKMFLAVVLLGGAMLFSTGCGEAECGCTDLDAVNYNEFAEEDDGSCTFEGKVVFWYGETTADGLVNDGATALTYYLDGVIVGSSAANIYWAGTTAPTCADEGVLVVTKDLANVKTQVYTYSVKDQTGFEYWTGIININANTCLQLELGWDKMKKK